MRWTSKASRTGFGQVAARIKALDALSVSIHGKRLKWVLDAILNLFVDSGIYQW
jgi:hypothetical protein